MNFDRSIFTTTCRFTIGTAAVVINIFYLYIFCRFPKVRTASCSALICMLNVSNLILGIGMLVRAAMTLPSYDGERFTARYCLLANISAGLGIFMNQAVVVGLALDRFSAVYKPMKYSNGGKNITIFTAILAVAHNSIALFAIFYGADLDAGVSLCSIGSSSGPHFMHYYALAGGLQSIFVISTYAVTFCMIKRSTQISRMQNKVFVWISLILLIQFVFWHVPLLMNISFLVLGAPRTMTAMVTLILGLSSGIQAVITTAISLVKHDEIRQCAVAVIKGGSQSSVNAVGSIRIESKNNVNPSSTRH